VLKGNLKESCLRLSELFCLKEFGNKETAKTLNDGIFEDKEDFHEAKNDC
jgi:hypothetical protein